MIQVRDLAYTYPGGKKIAFGDFKLDRGEHCLLLGESGCGKTTLLHLLGGLLRNNTGTINVNGSDFSKMSNVELDKFRGQHLGFIFQKNHLITALTVNQNLLMAPYLSGTQSTADRSKEILGMLNISDLKDARVTTLSQGQAQRVAIARALMNKPEVILADEPTSALDDKNCEAVIELLLQIAKANDTTLIIATHDSRLKSKFEKQIRLG